MSEVWATEYSEEKTKGMHRISKYWSTGVASTSPVTPGKSLTCVGSGLLSLSSLTGG